MNEEIEPQKLRSQEDTVLVKAFQSGGEASFDKLVLRYQDQVFRICYRFIGDYEEAKDCAQEIFIKVYNSLNAFRFESSVSTWLYRIAVNACKNKLRSLKYRRNRMMVRFDSLQESDGGSRVFEIENDSLSPEGELEKKERQMLIHKAINSLPKDQKMLVVLRDIEGFSYEDLTKITGYNPGTIKSKLSRARNKLRGKLKGLI